MLARHAKPSRGGVGPAHLVPVTEPFWKVPRLARLAVVKLNVPPRASRIKAGVARALGSSSIHYTQMCP